MKLFLIHCGYYDDEISNGIYEFHINLSVVAESLDDAKKKIRTNPVFAAKKMHIDGVQEIERVDGYQIQLVPTASASDESKIINHLYRDL